MSMSYSSEYMSYSPEYMRRNQWQNKTSVLSKYAKYAAPKSPEGEVQITEEVFSYCDDEPDLPEYDPSKILRFLLKKMLSEQKCPD